jgi:chorismate mutase
MSKVGGLIMDITLAVLFIVSLFMIFNMDAIRERFGIDTVATLKVQAQEQLGVIKSIQKAMTAKDVEIKQLNTQLEITKNTLADLTKDNKIIENKSKQIVITKENKVKAIMKIAGVVDIEGLQSVDAIAQTSEEITVFKENISNVNIDSLWESFCDEDNKCFKTGTGL